MRNGRPCPDCGGRVADGAGKCPRCGVSLWRRAVEEAFFSLDGLGPVDLIPGVRELPDPVRFGASMVSLVAIAILIGMSAPR